MRDFDDGSTLACRILRQEEIEGYGTFCTVDYPDLGELAVIVTDDRSQFTVKDWQGWQPKDVDEIPDFHWVDETGAMALMVDGLPRRLFG